MKMKYNTEQRFFMVNNYTKKPNASSEYLEVNLQG